MKKANNNKKKNYKDTYGATMAVYANSALSSLSYFLKTEVENLVDNNISDSQKEEYWHILKENIKLFKHMADNAIMFSEKKLPTKNYDRFEVFGKLLIDIRNYWSHYEHRDITITDNELREALRLVYNESCYHIAQTDIPEKYRDEKGLYKFKENPKGSEVIVLPEKKIRGDYGDELTLTGHIFVVSAFLPQHQVNSFLEDMELSDYDFKIIKKRTSFRSKNQKIQYPEKLIKKQKDFFYGRDLYTHWCVRGHKDTIQLKDEDVFREKAFELFEYLKRCPQERLADNVAENKKGKIDPLPPSYTSNEKESSDPYLKAHRYVKINDNEYPVRQKNLFFRHCLDFLDAEWERIQFKNGSVFECKWGRRASAEMLSKKKIELKEEDPLKSLPVHEKIIWDIPQDETNRLNSRSEETGFTWFLERDKQGEYSHAVFLFRHKGTRESIVGRMGKEALCTLLENYFYKFSHSRDTDKKRQQFFLAVFKNILKNTKEITDAGKNKKERPPITKDKIKNRITYLRNTYRKEEKRIEKEAREENPDPFSSSRVHPMIIYIAKTWNKMISYGQTNNLAHAKDSDKSVGGINGYQEILKYLSFMATDNEDSRKDAHRNLCNLLNCLGNRDRSGLSYHDAIYKQLKSSGILGNSGSPFPLKKKDTPELLYKQAKEYRSAMLDKFEKQLELGFDIDQWQPNAEMRWLGLKDCRTKDAAQNEENKPEKKNTGIYNVDNLYYARVGVQESWLIGKGNEALKNKHQEILSPNDNKLNIADFYAWDTWHHLPRTDRERIYKIKRQDAVLANIAYCYTLMYEGEYKGRELNTMQYDKTLLSIPVTITKEPKTEIIIKAYYRHFKQNRYQLERNTIENILHLARKENKENKNEKILDGNQIDMCPVYIDKDGEFKAYEDKDKNKLYLTKLFDGHFMQKKAFIAKLYRLERFMFEKELIKRREDEKFVNFKTITEKFIENNLLQKEDAEALKELRNKVMHNEIPIEDTLLLENTTGTTKEGEKFINYYGKGIEIIDHIVPKPNNS